VSEPSRSAIPLEARPRGGGPAWLVEARARVAKALEADGLPTPKTEAWRFTPARPFIEEAKTEVRGERADAGSRVAALPCVGDARVVLVDGRPVDLPSIRGVTLRPLDEALASTDLGLASLDAEDAFARLNALRFEGGLHVAVSAEASPDATLELVHVSSPGASSVRYPRLVVTVARGASCTLIERAIGSEDGTGASHTVVDVRLDEGARLEHVRVGEDRGLSTAHFAVSVGRSAFYGSRVVALAGRVCRTSVAVSLEGAGAETELVGVYLARGEDHLDHHLRVEHRAPHCTSHMRYHGVIDGKATAVFDGITVVHRDAQGTSGHQENRNLLLSEQATVHTKPHLEIDADDVKCSHGSTVGSLDEQALFYMRARGIPEDVARAMLTEAFVEAPIDSFPGERVQELVRALVRRARPVRGAP
jgi:Fe-S cluster assembly protein SufD